MLNTLLNKLPFGTQGKVFVGTMSVLGFSYVTFFHLFPKKKAGHNAFDVEKPEAVQSAMDRAGQARGANLLKDVNATRKE